ncbi:MAG: hypothetical protein ACR2PT_07930 [Endozoicomonas sp.]
MRFLARKRGLCPLSAHILCQTIREGLVKSLLLVLRLSLCLSSAAVCSDRAYASISCEAYVAPELESLCSGALQPVIDVYDEVDEEGLNALSEGWTTDQYHTHVRVIPPGRYRLSKPLVLQPLNRLLPHPTAPLPPGKKLRTIELQVADSYQSDVDYFYLLKLRGATAAGGVEIHADQLPATILSTLTPGKITQPRNTLVMATGYVDTILASSVLTGNEHLDSLYQTTFTMNDVDEVASSRSGSELRRNYLYIGRARTAVNVIMTEVDYLWGWGTFDRFCTITNSSIFIEAGRRSPSSGIYLGNGQLKAKISHNDFVFLPRDKTAAGIEQRNAVEIDDATDIAITSNAIYTPGARSRVSEDIGIYDRRGRLEGYHRAVIVRDNSFSPYINPGQVSASGEDRVLALWEDDTRVNSWNKDYPLQNPADFLAYRNRLGTRVQPVAVLTDPVNNTCASAEPDYISELDSMGLTSVWSFAFSGSSLSSLSCYKPHIPPSYIYAPLVQVIALPLFFLATSSCCGYCCYRCGLGRGVH